MLKRAVIVCAYVLLIDCAICANIPDRIDYDALNATDINGVGFGAMMASNFGAGVVVVAGPHAESDPYHHAVSMKGSAASRLLQAYARYAAESQLLPRMYNGRNAVYNCKQDSECVVLGDTASADECAARCSADEACSAFTWHGPQVPNDEDGYVWAFKCVFRVDGEWELKDGAHHVSGCFTNCKI